MALANALQDLAPIERPTLGGQAYVDLRKLIMSGRLAPGDRLPLRSVAQALGVSIMPVRDAINRLVAEQALAMTPSRAVRVPVMSPTEFQELATIRTVLEGFAAEQAAIHRSKEETRQIVLAERTYHDECMKSSPDPAKALLFNMNFHFAVYRAAKLPKLLEMIESLWLRVGPVFIVEVRSSPDRLATGSAHIHHRQAVAAIKAGDGPAAQKAIADDIRSAAAYILTRTQFNGAGAHKSIETVSAAPLLKSSSGRRPHRTLAR
jgi:DNA-binding GntR family transcriptional regulator